MNAMNKLIAARSFLVRQEPFFGVLAFQLILQADEEIETMSTDGSGLYFNPDFVASLSVHELRAVLAHEVLHCANGHFWRQAGREMKRWNQACDYAINPILLEAGFRLPEGALVNPAFKGLSAEAIYTKLSAKQQESQGSGQGQGQGQGQNNQQGSGQGKSTENSQGGKGSKMGQVQQPRANVQPETLKAQWEVATIQAAKAASAAGRIPGFAKRLVHDIRQPRTNPWAVLRRFVQQCARNDYSWKQPNSRFLASGLYLPVLRSEQMPPILIAVDTSGSISGQQLQQFTDHMNDIVDEVKPEKVYVVYCDAAVQGDDEFECGELIVLNAKGGGGTRFQPALTWAQERGITPACMVFLTDMYASDLGQLTDPGFPVLWASIGGQQAPFGELIDLRNC